MQRRGNHNRVANLVLGLRRRHNDTLANVNAVQLAEQFNLPFHFVRRLVADEIARRQSDAA